MIVKLLKVPCRLVEKFPLVMATREMRYFILIIPWLGKKPFSYIIHFMFYNLLFSCFDLTLLNEWEKRHNTVKPCLKFNYIAQSILYRLNAQGNKYKINVEYFFLIMWYDMPIQQNIKLLIHFQQTPITYEAIIEACKGNIRLIIWVFNVPNTDSVPCWLFIQIAGRKSLIELDT